jgi:hypothetical protein
MGGFRLMPRKKDSAAEQKLKAAERSANEIAVNPDYVPECQSDNPLVQMVWAKFAPPLIEAKIVNFATEETFTDLCFHVVVLRKLRHAILDENTEWFETVQNYGDGGVALEGKKEAGPLKAYRLWNSSYQKLLQDLSLRPRDMAGLWSLDKPEGDEDMFT